jgi:hypothetical protein
MQRLLVKITDKRLTRRSRDRNGLAYGRYALRVRVEGGAIDALSVPERFVGREASLARDFLMPWTPKKGDPLVLDPDESARILCPRARPARGRPFLGGRVRADSIDIDRDGFPEDVITGRFATIAVQPHRGARLAALLDPARHDRLGHTFDYLAEGKYVLLGGTEGIVEESGSPGELWNAPFAKDEPLEADGALEQSYHRSLKSPEGVRLSKTLRVEADLPGVAERYVIIYSGKRARGEGAEVPGEAPPAARAGGRDKKRGEDETPITFSVSIWPSVVGEIPSLNVFDVPGRSGLRTVRFHPPRFARRWRWRDWHDEHFGVGPGFVLWRHERLGRPTAVLWNPRLVSYVSIRSDFEGPRLSVRHVTKRLRRGGRAEFGLGYLVGDAFAASASSLLLLSKGRKRGGVVPVAVTLRTGRRVTGARARVGTASGGRTCTLAPREIPGAGRVYTRVLEVPARSFPLTCTVTVGGETLHSELRG